MKTFIPIIHFMLVKSLILYFILPAPSGIYSTKPIKPYFDLKNVIQHIVSLWKLFTYLLCLCMCLQYVCICVFFCNRHLSVFFHLDTKCSVYLADCMSLVKSAMRWCCAS